MIAGIFVAALAGLIARTLIPRPQPPRAVAILAGIVGMLAGAPIAHKISADHEFHAFRPESFIAAGAGAFVLLLIARLIAGRFGDPDDRRIFS